MKILGVLFPKQSNSSMQMEYDPETHSYRYRKFPTTTKSDVAAGNDTDTGTATGGTSSCGICLEKFTEDEMLMMGLCQHVFHRDCCMGWVVVKNTCPMCRKPMFDETTYQLVAESMKPCSSNQARQ